MCMCISPSEQCDRTYTNELPEASSPRRHTHSKGTSTHETHHHPRFSSNDEGNVSRYLFKLTRAARARQQPASRRALIRTRIFVTGRRAVNARSSSRGAARGPLQASARVRTAGEQRPDTWAGQPGPIYHLLFRPAAYTTHLVGSSSVASESEVT